MAGRKTKYTPETIEKLLQAIRMGATYDLACKYAGISFELFCQWRNEKVDFLDAVKEAEGQAAYGWLEKIEKAANDGNWQAAAWKLERRYPRDYGKTVQETEHSGQLSIEVRYVEPDTDAP